MRPRAPGPRRWATRPSLEGSVASCGAALPRSRCRGRRSFAAGPEAGARAGRVPGHGRARTAGKPAGGAAHALWHDGSPKAWRARCSPRAGRSSPRCPKQGGSAPAALPAKTLACAPAPERPGRDGPPDPKRRRLAQAHVRVRRADRGTEARAATPVRGRNPPPGQHSSPGTELAGASIPSIRAVLAARDPAPVTLARAGPTAIRDRYEPLHRHRAEAPNATWQADHTLLYILMLDQRGTSARPWLTTVIDNGSCVVAGRTAFPGASQALHTSQALHQAIWRKADPGWPVCGIFHVLYVDHGANLTSANLLPRRGCRSRSSTGQLAPPPWAPTRPSLGDRPGAARGLGRGRLPAAPAREPEGPVPPPDLARQALPDASRAGIQFEEPRRVSPTLAALVREAITIRALSEVRVFHHDRFLRRAVSKEPSGRGGDAQGHQGCAASMPAGAPHGDQRAGRVRGRVPGRRAD